MDIMDARIAMGCNVAMYRMMRCDDYQSSKLMLDNWGCGCDCYRRIQPYSTGIVKSSQE